MLASGVVNCTFNYFGLEHDANQTNIEHSLALHFNLPVARDAMDALSVSISHHCTVWLPLPINYY